MGLRKTHRTSADFRHLAMTGNPEDSQERATHLNVVAYSRIVTTSNAVVRAASYSRKKAEAVWMNSGQGAPMTGPWPALGTIQMRELGMALNISKESSTG